MFDKFFQKSSYDSQKLRKAKILLSISIVTLVFGSIYSLLAIFVMKKPELGIVVSICIVLSMLTIYFLKINRYEIGSNLIIFLFWVALTFLGTYPVFVQDKPVTILTRNTLLIFFFVVLFGEKKYQIIIIFAINYLFLFGLHVINFIAPIIKPELITFSNLINESIILILAFVLSIIKITITENFLKESMQRADLNNKKFEKLKSLILESKGKMSIGESLLNVSKQLISFGGGLSGQMSIIKEEIKKFDGIITSTEEKNASIAGYSGEVKESIVNEKMAMEKHSGYVKNISGYIDEVSKISNSKKNDIGDIINSSRKVEDLLSQLNDLIYNLNKSTSSMMEIIDVIVGIADKTDILAMNAAIEAAHAGTAGKGFAVVADEIRILAEQTSQNTKLISDTLKKNVDNINVASDTSKTTYDFFSKYNNEIKNITNSLSMIIMIVENIDKSTSDMLEFEKILVKSSETVNKSINDMENITADNNADISKLMDLSKEIRKSIDQNMRLLSDDFEKIISESRMLSDLGNENIKIMESLYNEMNDLSSE
jgi:methyl-accepting chemotaxis protein